jgi:putative ABC transport system permease protein
VVNDTLSRQQLGVTLMLIFGVTALVLAAISIYGVIADASARRGGEIGTRIALGASASQVFWLIMIDGCRIALMGVVLGLVDAYSGGLVVASSVYAMQANDVVIRATAAVLVMVITVAATGIPAIRATRIDPMRALRSDCWITASGGRSKDSRGAALRNH